MEPKPILEKLLEQYDAEALSDSDFEAHVSALTSRPVIIDDLRTAFECLRGNETALREMKGRLESAADQVSRDLMGDDDLKAELCQRTYVTLLYGGTRKQRPYLLTYGGRAPIQSWLRKVLLRRSIAERQRQNRESLQEASVLNLIPAGQGSNPELEILKQRYAAQFQTAFRHSLAALSAKERTVLRYHLSDGLTAEEIGRRFRVHRVTIMRWLRYIKDALLKTTKAHLVAQLDVKPADLDGVFGLIESRVSPSFAGIRSATTFEP